MKIKTLSNELDGPKEEVTYVYSKKINDREIKGAKKTRKFEKDKISSVINSLLPLGKIKFLKELYLKQNCKDWINKILSSYPKIRSRIIKELLNDFTDSMNTRMREEEKYVVCIVTSKFVILCHSRFGEETITPNCEVIERMLDKDNVLRFVYFEREKEDIKIIFFEDTPSVFFATWLGIPEREAFGYLEGKNKLFGEINGATLVFEFTDDEFEKKFIEEKIFKIDENQLILSNPVQNIPLVQIRVGRRYYANYGDFMQDFYAKRYELAFYKEKYTELNSAFDLWTKKIIDDKYEVRDSTDKVLVKKTNKNFSIIFSNKKIEIRPSFLFEIRSKLLNNESFRIFHAGGKVSPNPIKIKNIEIYNELDQKISKILLDYYSELPIKDDFEKILIYLIFELLSLENSGKEISFFLKELANSINSKIDFSNKFANSENDIIEFKSRDYFSGNNKHIVENLCQDIKKKIKKSATKIYIIGANEDTKDFEPLQISKFDDNRMQDLEGLLKEQTGLSNLHFQKIPANNGKECLLILIASNKNE
ncbi:MAG: hypothetical protein FIB07_17880 [Candidatus Methanoperedens sp.]|nr:hypothetical protein [Candidatus Methanoperedens sp.]